MRGLLFLDHWRSLENREQYGRHKMRCKHFYSVENDCSYMLIWTSDAVTLSTPLSQEREVDSEEWRNAEERTKESEREREFRLRFIVLHSRSVVHDPYNTNSCTCVFLQDYEDKIIHNHSCQVGCTSHTCTSHLARWSTCQRHLTTSALLRGLCTHDGQAKPTTTEQYTHEPRTERRAVRSA